jgi:GTP-binding protein
VRLNKISRSKLPRFSFGRVVVVVVAPSSSFKMSGDVFSLLRRGVFCIHRHQPPKASSPAMTPPAVGHFYRRRRGFATRTLSCGGMESAFTATTRTTRARPSLVSLPTLRAFGWSSFFSSSSSSSFRAIKFVANAAATGSSSSSSSSSSSAGREGDFEKKKTKKKTTGSSSSSSSSTKISNDSDSSEAVVELSSREQKEMDREAAKFASSWAKELAKASAESMEQLELTKTVSDEYAADDEEEEEDNSKKISPEDDQKTRRRRTRRDWGTIPQELLPKVAVVGRPNVGKSALFNRLTGTKRAIVFDEPGVTRDRMYVRAFWGDHEFMLVDTGGLENLPGDPNAAPSIDRIGGVEILPGMIEAQAAEAVREADVLIFVTDGQAGLTAADKEIFRWLRKHHADIPVHLAVNKCESSTRGEEMVLDFWQLSSKNVAPIGVSAISGTGTGELLDAVCESLPEPPTMEEQISIAEENKEKEDKPLPIQVAIVGRPNVGKSSLLNGLAGTPRSIVSDFSGTTRDTIDTDVTDKNHPDREFTLIDTAGIRRRTQIKRDTKSIKGDEKKFGLEQQSIGRALQAMKRADVVVLVIDATEGATQQDFVLAERAVQEGCALVLCCNKWDLVDKDTYTMNSYTDDLRSKLRVFEWASIIYTSALTGQRISKILDASYEASVIHKKRLTTATLNAVVQEATLWKAPPAKANKKGRIYYTTQAAIRPPTFVFFCNDPKLFSDTYKRYMEKQLRKNIGFDGTPIRLLWRGKSKGGGLANATGGNAVKASKS